jgi:hypothetical protein
MADRYAYRGDSYRGERRFADRARDELRSWFGDDEAERRRRADTYSHDPSSHEDDRRWRPSSERSEASAGRDADRLAGSRDRWWNDERNRWGRDESRRRYDRSGATLRGWNEPNYGYRPAFGFGHSDWSPSPHQGRASRRPGETRGYYEDEWGGTYEFDRYESRSFAGKGPKGYRRSDERIREDVCDRLADDPRVDATDIEVAVSDGEVTLGGFVRSRDEKRWSEDVSEMISGVRDVHNNLRLRPSPEAGIAPSGVPS